MRDQFGINVVVSNNSWASAPGAPPSALLHDAIAEQIDAGILFVAAAANDTNNNDAVPTYPASYDLDGIISVAATSQFDTLASYSNYGQTTVDLAAPGGDGPADSVDLIVSTWPPSIDPFSNYNWIQGTSMASPHVAGVAALIRGLAPEMSVMQTKNLILDSVDPLPSLQGIVLTGGRLNAATCLQHVLSSQIEGTVWNDTNGNGVLDGGEAGIAGWTVYADMNNSQTLDPGEPSAITDANGDYVIVDFFAPGTYKVRQELQPHWQPTYPASGVQTITFAERGELITDVDFGNQPEPGSVSGVKWNDLDGNGVRDEGEPGMGGIYIYADLNNDGMIALGEPAAITAADGSYMITGLPAGSVAIREVLTPGWEITYPLLGYYQVDVMPAENIPDIDFGNASSVDWGDAPAPYPTLAADGGASHAVLPGFQLGELIDGEPDGLPSATAVGDDLDNLADEDGVIFSGPLYASGTSSVDVIVMTSGFPKGYLHAWIDYNADGDWNDAGEQIATNLRLGEGTHTLSFDVPADAKVGSTFARFRYSLERDLGPTGPASAGEVEDYSVLVLKDEPVANPDSFEVEQDSVNNTLDVLANDFPSSTGVLDIISVTQPEHGTVSIAPGSQTVVFTPDFGTFSPPLEQFSYTIDDGTGKTDSAVVSVLVRPQLIAPEAVDDTFRVAAGSGANQLQVLANDLPGVLGTMDLISVTTPSFGTATINDNGTADPLDDYIVYTPNGSFSRLDEFQYTISNANGTSTATATILATPAPDDLTVDYAISFEDMGGNPINEINIGQQFAMIVTVQDLRTGLDPTDAGIFAGYLDTLYDRNLVLPVFDAANGLGFDITFSAAYPNGLSGDAQTPGILDEVGAFQLITFPSEGLGSDPVELFRTVFTANTAGVAEFNANPADLTPQHDTVYFSPTVEVPPADINYGLASLTIVDPNAGGGGGGAGEGESLDVNGDGSVSPIDVLMVITHLNSSGAVPSNTGDIDPRLDVNHDSVVSPIDALLVINYLNNGEGEGEGEAGGLASASSLTATQPSLLGSETLSTLTPVNLVPSSPAETASPASAAPAPAPMIPFASQDWLQQVGTSSSHESAYQDPEMIVHEHWDSLLDTLAEDVLEAWLDGEDA